VKLCWFTFRRGVIGEIAHYLMPRRKAERTCG
jgi:hypothetical protein